MPHRKIFSLSLFVFALLACALLFCQLNQDTFLRGADAYYYALQSHYWALTGAVKIPDSSFIHVLNGLLERQGYSGETTLRFWQCFSLFISFLSFFCLYLYSSRKWDWLVLLLFWIWIFSPTQLFAALEFPKMFSSFLLLPLWFLFLVRNPAKPFIAILVSGLSTFFHPAALPLALLFSLFLFFFYFSFPRKKMFSFLLLILVFVFSALFLLRNGERFSWDHFQLGYFSLLFRQNLPLALRIEMLLAPLFYVMIAKKTYSLANSKKWEIYLAPLLCLPAFIPLGVDQVFSVGERYALWVPSLLWIGSLFLITRLPVQSPWNLKTVSVALGALLIFLPAERLRFSHPLEIDPDFSSYQRVVEDLKSHDMPMLIAHKGFVFFYKYKWMREAFAYEPEAHWNKKRIWRLLYRIQAEELNYYLPENCSWSSGNLERLPESDSILIREDCWAGFREKITKQENEDLYHRVWETWLNPSQKRPAFLYKKHENDAADEFPALAPDSKSSR